MKLRKPRKARNLAAKALRECKLFAPKSIPARKGKGAIYSRKGRNAVGPSGPYLLWGMALNILTGGPDFRIVR
jgi:stalled ribosome alternative rescue factor ArfA